MNRLSTLALQIRNKVNFSSPLSRNTRASALDFQDVSKPDGFEFMPRPFARLQEQEEAYYQVEDVKQLAVYPKKPNLRRNKSERIRLQGLFQSTKSDSSNNNNTTTTTQISLKSEKSLKFLKKLFSNEGGRRTFFACWLLIHALVFSLGMVHYSLKGMLKSHNTDKNSPFPFSQLATDLTLILPFFDYANRQSYHSEKCIRMVLGDSPFLCSSITFRSSNSITSSM